MQTILVVNSNHRNQELLAQYLGPQGFQIVCASTYAGLAQVLAKGEDFGVAVVDITGFDPEIWNYCDQMRSQALPFLVVASRFSRVLERECLSHGSSGILTKPLVPKELMQTILSFLGE